MTDIGNIPEVHPGRGGRSSLLVPLLTAALVMALGLLLVWVTEGEGSSGAGRRGTPPAVTSTDVERR